MSNYKSVTRNREREREYKGVKDRNIVRVKNERRYFNPVTRCGLMLNVLPMQNLKRAKCNTHDP
jgi:hypothetical protein